MQECLVNAVVLFHDICGPNLVSGTIKYLLPYVSLGNVSMPETSIIHSLNCQARKKQPPELVFLNPYGAQESMPRHQFRQPM
jgi:hypothetical protein